MITLTIIILSIILFLPITALTISYICFRIAFYVSRRNDDSGLTLPPDEVYEPYRKQVEKWMEETKGTEKETVSITSFDGLKLYGKYYECIPGAPIELMMHGYRGRAERDLSGGVQRCFKLGRNALIIDQRACGKSEGNVITFGINEYRDCLSWIDFIIKHFGEDTKIILCGISMGASTVLIASQQKLPKNVVGVLADCGYTSAKDIIKKTIKEMKLPPNLSYPFVKLGGLLFGHFNIDEVSSKEAVKKATIPIIFIHGDNDDFVPCYMSKENFEACTSAKQLLIVKGAAHGLSYPASPHEYLNALADFFSKNGLPTTVIK